MPLPSFWNLPPAWSVGEDQLEAALAGLLVLVDGDPAAVVADGHGVPRLVQGQRDLRSVAVHGLVDGVVEDLPHAVVQAGAVHAPDVHAGALADGLQTLEDRELVGVVVLRHLRGLLRRAPLQDRCGHLVGDDALDAAVLLDLRPDPAARRRAVLHRGDVLLRAPVRLDREQVAVAPARLEAQQPVVLADLDELHALARAGQVVDLGGGGDDAAAALGDGEDGLAPVHREHPHDVLAGRGPRELAAAPRRGLDELVEAEAQGVPVGRRREAVKHRTDVGLLGSSLMSPSRARGSKLTTATMRSPSLSLKVFWIGSPKPLLAGRSMKRAV